MDLLLINPPYFDHHEMEERYRTCITWVKEGNMYVVPFEPPLGLASLAAFLKREGFKIELLDIPGKKISELELINYLEARKPTYVGITVMSSTTSSAFKIARIVKSVLPLTKIIVGGVHPTLDPGLFLKNRDIDYVVRGEGEYVIQSFFTSNSLLFSEIAGLCFRDGSKEVIRKKAPLIKDLNLLPIPDYHAFPVKVYIEYNKNLRGIKGISMLVSRGCPYPCSFCAVKSTMGKIHRCKNPKTVVDEMEYLQEEFKIEGIWFKDSIFNLNREWIKDFCNEIKRRDLKLTWQCNSRVDLVCEEEIELMSKSGLIQLDLGIESGSLRSLKVLRKRYTLEDIKKAVAISKKYVKVAGFFMIGIPGETEKDIDETFTLAASLKLDRYCFSMFVPLPGSELYEKLRSEGKIDKDHDLRDFHFTLCQKSFCEVPPEKLKKRYEEINDYFAKD